MHKIYIYFIFYIYRYSNWERELARRGGGLRVQCELLILISRGSVFLLLLLFFAYINANGSFWLVKIFSGAAVFITTTLLLLLLRFSADACINKRCFIYLYIYIHTYMCVSVFLHHHHPCKSSAFSSCLL
jgi:chromate transport protein ChrA